MKELKEPHTFFRKTFPELVALFEKYQVSPILIGGTVRDYVLTGLIGRDLDIEVHLKKREDWEKLKEDLQKIVSVKELGYKILSFSFKKYQLELTLPRTEIFDGSVGHKNFRPEFYAELDFKTSFIRRDFTINAIGCHLLSGEIVDPYQGLVDLENKLLKPLGPDFVKDPVRFIRGVRFKNNLGLVYDPSLIKMMKEEKLLGLNAFALNRELEKTKDKKSFIRDFYELFESSELRSFFKNWATLPDQEMRVNELHLFLLWEHFSKDYITFFNLSLKSYQRMIQVLQNDQKGIEKLKDKERELVLNFASKRS